ncbi:hypothetical protein P7K49_027585, partial [Saguinus oedipus]
EKKTWDCSRKGCCLCIPNLHTGPCTKQILGGVTAPGHLQHETVIPGELPLVQELTSTLREWAVIWRKLYVKHLLLNPSSDPWGTVPHNKGDLLIYLRLVEERKHVKFLNHKEDGDTTVSLVAFIDHLALTLRVLSGSGLLIGCLSSPEMYIVDPQSHMRGKCNPLTRLDPVSVAQEHRRTKTPHLDPGVVATWKRHVDCKELCTRKICFSSNRVCKLADEEEAIKEMLKAVNIWRKRTKEEKHIGRIWSLREKWTWLCMEGNVDCWGGDWYEMQLGMCLRVKIWKDRTSSTVTGGQ